MPVAIAAYAATKAVDIIKNTDFKTRTSSPSSLQDQRAAQSHAMLARALNGDTSVLPEMIRLAQHSATDDANQVFAADLRQYFTTKNIVPDATTAAIIGWQTAAVLAASTANLADLRAKAAADVKFEFTPNTTFGPPLNYRVNAQGNTYDLTTGARLSGSEINKRWANLGSAPPANLASTANGALPATAPIGAAPIAGTPAAGVPIVGAPRAPAAAGPADPTAALLVGGVVLVLGAVALYTLND